MSVAFSEGPWFAGKLVLADDDDDFGTISIGQQDLSDRPNKDAHYEDTIAEVWQNPNLAEDAEANANLIAAAPEMYGALSDIMGAVLQAFPALAHQPQFVRGAAALAKARGR